MKESHRIENEDIFEEFIIDREIRTATIKNYKKALQLYSDFTNKTLKELIVEADKEEDDNIKLKWREINNHLRGFKLRLRELGYVDSTIDLYMLLVRAFYGHNDIELPKNKKRGVKKSKRIQKKEDIPEMEEIRRFMEHLKSVYKAMVVICLSSGMGSSEVTSLTFKHLYKACSVKAYPETLNQLIEQLKSKGNIIPTWDIIRIKKDFPYTTFSSPESIHRIIVYLEDLNNKFPNYKPKSEDKLFRSLFTNNPLKANSFSSIFGYINRAYPFRKTDDNRNIIKTHSLRKFFATTLESNKVPHLTTRRLLGHSVDSVTSAYFKVDVESLKDDYMNVVCKLLTTEQDVIVLDKYEGIRQDVDTLKEQFGGLVLKAGKISGFVPEEYIDIINKEETRQLIKFEKSMKDNPEYYENEYRKAMNENLI